MSILWECLGIFLHCKFTFTLIVDFHSVSVFSCIASSPDPDVEEDGEDDEDPDADRDPDHRMEDVCRFLGEVDLHNVGAHLILCKATVLSKVIRLHVPNQQLA